MWDPFHRAGRSRDVAEDHQRWSSASPNLANFGFPKLPDLIEFAGLCGTAFCLGAGAALYLENSHVWTTEAIAATEDRPQIVNRLRKDDRLPATARDRWSRSADVQDGFGMLEVGGSLNATITIRDAKGRLVFELDPVRRTTVISKREARGVPSPKEQDGQTAPKSRVVPVEGAGDCDPSGGVSRIAAICAPSTEMRAHYSRISQHYSKLAQAAELGALAYDR
jgi:hypothetical protein